ncbi:sugar ABC transporter substrate-binding protein [Streptomyces sp. NPDC059900]|uniref:ABC transporter substrate-binding protein n=1 Tax=Streptomyces sp. NPDC059900 TaxID=3155816 RepID=UPI0034172AFD
MAVARRALLGAAVAGAGAVGFARRSGFSPSNTGSAGADTLTFSLWGADTEIAAFQALARAYERRHSGIRVQIRMESYQQMYTNMDALLAGGRAPDLFRCDYANLGMYSASGQLLDLSPYLGEQDREAFLPALWEAVCHEGKPYAVPHHTDTTAVLYRKDMFRTAGITSVPASLDEAWTWDEFTEICARLSKKLHGVYPFVYGWQQTGAFRWLTWLWQAGGRILDESRTAPAIESAAGLRALRFTQDFFRQGFVPPNSSVKSAAFPDALFTAGTVAMSFAGDFLLPTIDPALKKDLYGVTFQPRGRQAATDLGGNAVVATRDTENPELAADFLKFLAEVENMARFCEQCVVLPTRKSLLGKPLDYAVRPDLMPVYAEQATALTPAMTAQVAVPGFGRINSALQDELEAAFVNRQPADVTLRNIAASTRTALASA